MALESDYKLVRKFQYPYISPTPGEMPIVAVKPNIGSDVPSIELCEDLKQCGFNTAIMSITLSKITEGIINAKDKVGVILMHSHLLGNNGANKEYIEPFVKGYKNLKNLVGWFIFEKPTLDKFSNISDCLNDNYVLAEKEDIEEAVKGKVQAREIAMYVDRIVSADDTQKLRYISLPPYPYYGSENVTYSRMYIKAFYNLLHPNIWPISSNAKPFYYKDSDKEYWKPDYKRYFSGLAIAKLLANVTLRPWWCIVPALRSETGIPSELYGSLLRFNVWTSLAYGAKGVVYSAYRGLGENTENMDSITNSFGEHTKLWPVIQALNSEISAWSTLLLNSQVVECRHIGNSDFGYGKLLENRECFGPFEQISIPENKLDTGILLSHLHCAGADYVMIVNQNIENDVMVALIISSYYKVAEQKMVIGVQPFLKSSNIINVGTHESVPRYVTIEAGGYLLYKWE